MFSCTGAILSVKVVSDPSPLNALCVKFVPETACLTVYALTYRPLTGAVPKVRVVPDTLYES